MFATASLLMLALGGCQQLPSAGPTAREIDHAIGAQATPDAIQIVDLDQAVAQRLAGQYAQQQFANTLGQEPAADLRIGPGDALEITIWEAPPPTLFSSSPDPRVGLSSSHAVTLPEQIVDARGYVSVPFAGRISAKGDSAATVQMRIARSLRGKANQPEVLVRVTRRTSAVVTVVGDVSASVRMPLTESGERLLDALAAAGGVRQDVNKTMVQVTRGATSHSMPLDQVIRDPKQNVPLHAGDVVTALFQPFSFTAHGATGRNEEVSFEAQGINLAQALARTGGLQDMRSNPAGVFVFRFEHADALEWPRPFTAKTPDGRVAVIYRVDLRDPVSFFVMQNFAIHDDDLLYVSNAPAADLQKFLNVVLSIAYPILNISQQLSN